jgi:hypothetical protein
MKNRFAEIAGVRAGYPFLGRVVPDSGAIVRVVQIRDVTDAGGVRTDMLLPVPVAKMDSIRFFPGNLLFLAAWNPPSGCVLRFDTARLM